MCALYFYVYPWCSGSALSLGRYGMYVCIYTSVVIRYSFRVAYYTVLYYTMLLLKANSITATNGTVSALGLGAGLALHEKERKKEKERERESVCVCVIWDEMAFYFGCREDCKMDGFSDSECGLVMFYFVLFCLVFC